jgi:hypothetical protein
VTEDRFPVPGYLTHIACVASVEARATVGIPSLIPSGASSGKPPNLESRILSFAELSASGARRPSRKCKTTISYSLPADATVRLTVHDALGREMAVLVDKTRPAGKHSVSLDAASLTAGVFLVRLEAAGCMQIKRMSVMKKSSVPVNDFSIVPELPAVAACLVSPRKNEYFYWMKRKILRINDHV